MSKISNKKSYQSTTSHEAVINGRNLLNPITDLTNLTWLDNKKLGIEEEKLTLEKRKLGIEEEKLILEKRKLVVTSLLEEFKVRSREYFNFQNENSRWQGVYATALIIATEGVRKSV